MKFHSNEQIFECFCLQHKKKGSVKRKIVSVMFCKNVSFKGKIIRGTRQKSLYKTKNSSEIHSATYYSVKEWMLEAFANGDSLLGVNHEAFAN